MPCTELNAPQLTGNIEPPCSQSSVSACMAVQREFDNSIVLRPTIALVLGADKNSVNFDKKTILLRRWDRSLFAEGVVILAFEDLLTPQRRMMMTNRAVYLAQATVNAGDITK
jgi:hypothetical protein